MSLTIDARKEELDLIYPLSLPSHRKRKRHIDKQREGQSMRLSMRQRGC
jgi:hypothetical protein